jgi:hypothetical protein
MWLLLTKVVQTRMGYASNQRLKTDHSSVTPKAILYQRQARKNARSNSHCRKAMSGQWRGLRFLPLITVVSREAVLDCSISLTVTGLTD